MEHIGAVTVDGYRREFDLLQDSEVVPISRISTGAALVSGFAEEGSEPLCIFGGPLRRV